MEQMLMHVKRVVIERLDIVASFHTTSSMLNEVQASNPGLVNGYARQPPNNQIAGVLRNLLRKHDPKAGNRLLIIYDRRL